MMNAFAWGMILLVAVFGVAGYWWLSDSVDQPVLQGQWLHRSVEVGQRDRSYSLYVPDSAEASPPLIIVLHGSMGSGEAIRRQMQYGFDRLADQNGFVVAYPDGFEGHWNDCRRDAPYEARTQNINDLGFLRAIINQASARYGVDRNRVLVVGYSNGGHLAFRVAMEESQLVSALAVIGANLPEPGYSICPDVSMPVSAMIINGRRDPINPYNGGDVSLFGFGSRGRVLSSAQSIAGLGASGLPDEVETVAHSEVHIESWHAEDSTLHRLVTLEDGGHTVPTKRGRMPRILGPTNRDIEAAELIWEFFREVPRDRRLFR